MRGKSRYIQYQMYILKKKRLMGIDNSKIYHLRFDIIAEFWVGNDLDFR